MTTDVSMRPRERRHRDGDVTKRRRRPTPCAYNPAGRSPQSGSSNGGSLIPGLLAVLYAALIAARWGGAEGGFSSLADVRKLFADPWLLLAGWVHYLVFDLFIGAWEVRDAGRLGIPHLLVVPCLVLTFLLGPVGLLLYGIVRAVRTRRLLVDEAAA